MREWLINTLFVCFLAGLATLFFIHVVVPVQKAMRRRRELGMWPYGHDEDPRQLAEDDFGRQMIAHLRVNNLRRGPSCRIRDTLEEG